MPPSKRRNSIIYRIIPAGGGLFVGLYFNRRHFLHQPYGADLRRMPQENNAGRARLCGKRCLAELPEGSEGVAESAMLPFVLLFIFWAVVPGLITGWMFGERGRRFVPGLLLGIVSGPVGILAALAFIYVAERRDARGRPPGRGRAVRVFYDIPVVGRLHVSTVWALAGLATFLCLWMVGGVGYELYRAGLNPAPSERAADAPPVAPQIRERQAATTSQAGPPANDSRGAAPAQENIPVQPRAALLGNISAQPGQAAPANSRSENSSTRGGQPTSPDAAPP